MRAKYDDRRCGIASRLVRLLQRWGEHHRPRARVTVLGMAIKYIHARMPGRTLVHLISPEGLRQDERFGEHSEFVVGHARALCGKESEGWISGSGGEPCRDCTKRR